MPGKQDLLKALASFQKGDNKPFVISRTPYYIDIRPIRLTKRECVACHSGMKRGDIVALGVYTVSAN